MDTRISGQLRDIISKNTNIGIALGKNPDVDAMASALSLYLALKNEGKNVDIVCPSDVLVEHSSLVGVDKVRRNFEGGGGDMIVSFPYTEEGEIEKISYTLENGFLNIIVKAGEQGLSFSEKDVIFKRSQGYPSVLFVIGTSRLSDLEKIYDPTSLKDTTVINIDNKPDNQGFGDISIVSQSSSSISEKVADLMFSLPLNVDIDIAQNLLVGIESATDNFQYPKTTPLAFEITGELIRKGAIRKRVASSKASEDLFTQEEPSVFTPGSFPRYTGRSQKPPLQSISTDTSRTSRQAMQDITQDRKDLTSERKDKGKKPPIDWLTPKIYKGSTNI